jgi:hypothetical protein
MDLQSITTFFFFWRGMFPPCLSNGFHTRHIFFFTVPYQRVECPNGEVVRKMYVGLNVPRLLLLSDVKQNCNGSTDLISKKTPIM